jgi:hypothetical protein
MSQLRKTLPDNTPVVDRHRYLVRSIAGTEADSFASRVGKLSLVLADYPSLDGWMLEQGDVFTDQRVTTHLEKATVVLSNPPFEDFAIELRDHYRSVGITSRGPAQELLRMVLEHPPQKLGIVLPLSFVDGRGFSSSRRKLLENYGYVYVLSLPEGVFGHSAIPCALLIASGLGESSTNFECAQVTRSDLGRFARKYIPSWTDKASKDVALSADSFWISPLESVWQATADIPTLSDFATAVHRGVEYQSFKHNQPSKHLVPGYVPGLARVTEDFQPFYISDHDYVSVRPKEMRGGALNYPWNEPKVILNASRTSRGPWRAIAAPDRDGLVCSQRFHGIWPRSGVSVDYVSAVLNGLVANAFLGRFPEQVDNQIRAVKRVPFPRSNSVRQAAIEGLVVHYRFLRTLHYRGIGNIEADRRSIETLGEIDRSVLDAYDFPESIRTTLLDHFAESPRPFIQEHPFDKREWYFSGFNQDRVNGDAHTEDVLLQLIDPFVEVDFLRRIARADHRSASITKKSMSTVAAAAIVNLLSEVESLKSISNWFEAKNEYLGNATPSDLLPTNPELVLDAAMVVTGNG